MMKFINRIIFLAIIVLACVGIYQGVLERFVIHNSEVDYTKYEKMYYYNQLTEEQKEIYIKLDIGIDELKPKIHLGFQDAVDYAVNLEKALDAIYKDRPEYYFLPRRYNINTIAFLKNNYVYIEFDYTVKDAAERQTKDIELNNVIEQIIYDVITDEMTDIEKQIALHDKLVQHVEYYNYTDISSIPSSKHTSYEALVNKEAVCDGISRAMMLLLNRVGIETIIVSGEVDNVPHAWNIVKLDEEYYHMDVTSDKIEIDANKHVVHKYFNVNDDEIQQTHTISEKNNIPECNETKYNYYIYNNFYIEYLENMKNKTVTIIDNQLGKEILEVKIDKLYTIDDLLDTMYFIDFNNWRTDKKTSVVYHNLGNVYVFENKMTKPISY